MGDFSANFHRPESGIHTVEGNVAGSRAAQLARKREAEQLEFEERKRQIQSSSSLNTRRFESTTSITKDKVKDRAITGNSAEEVFRQKTVGLVTVEEFQKAAREAESGNIASQKNEKKKHEAKKLNKKKRKKKLLERKKVLSTLSFIDDGDEDEEDLFNFNINNSNTNSVTKDPSVDTSFLPDKQRERSKLEEQEKLKEEWQSKQSSIKKEVLEITYSYWDGSGHRRVVNVTKGDTIGSFLETVRKDLLQEFKELNSISSDALLYVKEDLIIPHDISFYDLIVTKARGKSGPLFNFDVHEDIRIGVIDHRVEKDESHPGKVILRQWYDRNKHIFPASRWEIFDASKQYGSYTIHGGEVQK